MPVRLYAISDLHLGFAENREALRGLSPHPEDWLVLGGDVGESLKHMQLALETSTERFARVIWVPGNHELWTSDEGRLRGQEKYDALVDLCRSFSVLTPEDPYPVWEGEGGPLVVAPLFLLYDYSFRPAGVSREGAVAWAAESGVVCADERFLDPRPHAGIDAWCHARCEAAEARLEEAAKSAPLVLVNHFPLREDLVRLWRIPRFSIWCGTKRTEDWHLRFRARIVVSGHLHVRSTDWIDGVRFEEVSLGYPRHWTRSRPIDSYLREILPARRARPKERSRGARGESRSDGGVRG